VIHRLASRRLTILLSYESLIRLLMVRLLVLVMLLLLLLRDGHTLLVQ